jgi:hypothetical protein
MGLDACGLTVFCKNYAEFEVMKIISRITRYLIDVFGRVARQVFFVKTS